MTDMSLKTAETPSGKGARDENFPVGSILLPRRLRPHVAVFYAYARAIDDVAGALSDATAEAALPSPVQKQGYLIEYGRQAMATRFEVILNSGQDELVRYRSARAREQGGRRGDVGLDRQLPRQAIHMRFANGFLRDDRHVG